MSDPVNQDKDYRISPPPAEKTQDGTRTYRVVYEIDVIAASPLEAARQVEEIFRDPGSMAPAFTILDSEGNKTDVDLFAQGLEERYGPVVELRPVDGDPGIPENPETPA